MNPSKYVHWLPERGSTLVDAADRINARRNEAARALAEAEQDIVRAERELDALIHKKWSKAEIKAAKETAQASQEQRT